MDALNQFPMFVFFQLVARNSSSTWQATTKSPDTNVLYAFFNSRDFPNGHSVTLRFCFLLGFFESITLLSDLRNKIRKESERQWMKRGHLCAHFYLKKRWWAIRKKINHGVKSISSFCCLTKSLQHFKLRSQTNYEEHYVLIILFTHI